MTKAEIKVKEEEIIDFSGCAMYIDTPVKRYSSGMRVRLAFAVAAHLEPDILVVDEVLAVGDAEFQKKAIGKMKDISGNDGRTVLFVSHNMAAVKSLCTRGIVLENGISTFEGTSDECVDYYLENKNNDIQDSLYERNDRRGNGKLVFEKVLVKNNGKTARDLQSGCRADFEIYFKIKSPCESVIFRFSVLDKNETTLFICNNKISAKPIDRINENGKVILTIPDLPLSEGYYNFNLAAKSKGSLLDEVEYAGGFSVISDDYFKTGKLPKAKSAILVKNNWFY
jgi:lipopolysaccharide transport system ATP-binding protein